MYKILFAGLGSIGKRHIRNVVDYLEDRNESFRIDAIRSNRLNKNNDNVNDLLYMTYNYDDEITEVYDILFITNPTCYHYETLKKYSCIAKNIFIEKPVFDTYTHDFSTLNLDGKCCYVACPLRYNAVLQYVKNNIDCSAAISVRSISSSYLPDWRPDQDYRLTYSANKKMGGGVAIDLIHEWDYLTWLFGEPDQVACIHGKNSKLEIDSDDVAIYIAKRDSLTYELHLDYFGRYTIRELQIYLPDETIVADIANGTIKYLTSDKIIDLSEDRNQYQMREIMHFFDIIEKNEKNDNNLLNAISVMRLAMR